MTKTGKLELTWVGKYDEKKIEPRLLIEDKNKSNIKFDDRTENLLIHGDNLIALKALEKSYAGSIKCIYIDPPYNIDVANPHYDDGLAHSEWLNIMRPRLEILKNLLSEDGSIWISIDEEEGHYLKVLCDEIFGRKNFIIMTAIKRGEATGHKAINPTPVQVCDLMLTYARNKDKWVYKPVYRSRSYDYAYSSFIENFDQGYEKWEFISLKVAMEKYNFNVDCRNDADFKRFSEFSHKIIRFAQPDYKAVGKETKDLINVSKEDDKIHLLKRVKNPDIYLYKGNRILFYKDKLRVIDGKLTTAELVTNIWEDMNYQGIAREGNVQFSRSKKPESQIRRILQMSTNPGDFVLDSFLGSGTTAAVAHKMGRKWIGIELGDHAYTHCKNRLDSVIEGEQSGISKVENWKGGGGYRFFELASSLLVKHEKLPIYEINKEFSFEMLCESICKLEGFKYEPVGEMHGFSSETRFIHIANEMVTGEYIKYIYKNLKDTDSVIIYTNKVQSNLNLPDNIEVKRIPKDLLNKYDFESEV